MIERLETLKFYGTPLLCEEIHYYYLPAKNCTRTRAFYNGPHLIFEQSDARFGNRHWKQVDTTDELLSIFEREVLKK